MNHEQELDKLKERLFKQIDTWREIEQVFDCYKWYGILLYQKERSVQPWIFHSFINDLTVKGEAKLLININDLEECTANK